MDFNFDFDYTFTFTLIVLISLIITLLKPKSKSTSNLPPGPRKLPLIGNLHLFATSRPPHRILTELALKHGPVMHLQLGEISTIAVSSPEAAKQFLKTHDIIFANRPSLFVTNTVFYKNSDIAFSPYGEYWRRLRRICTVELFSARRIQSFRPIREEAGLNLCRWIASKEGSLINFTQRISFTICEIVKGVSIGAKGPELTTFISFVKEISDLGAGFYIEDVYPSIRLFRLFSSQKRRAEKLHREADSILERIIDDHRRIGTETEGDEDLVNVLLKFTDAGNELHLTTDNIKAVLLDIFSGGIETSSSTIDWAMAEMMKHPRVLKKAQDEVRQVFKDKDFVDENDFDELKYLKLVVKETLRMHLPLPLLFPRENIEPCDILGYQVPAKTRVMVNAWMIGRHPEHWEDADSFIPERHIEKSVDYKGTDFDYIPFGAGRRICPGISLGLVNVEFLIAMLLYHFDWLLPQEMKPENVDMTESIGISSARKNALYMIPIIEKPLPAV